MNDLLNRYRGCLVGLAVGDALGVPLEFQPRDAMPLVTEMIGNGPFHLKVGEWTDDTSMALCLAQSLLDCDGFDAKDQMNKYWKWVEEGYMSSTGELFDIGNTTSDALCRYRKTGDPFAGLDDPSASGNGSLMRLAPIPMYFVGNKDAAIRMAVDMSRTTHSSEDCLFACAYYCDIIARALDGCARNDLPEYKNKLRSDVKSSGYVMHTLDAALWSFYNTDNFEDGAVLAVNLAYDSDTTGAVYGQLAGAYYGYDAIPKRWLDKLVKLDMIVSIADKLFDKRKL